MDITLDDGNQKFNYRVSAVMIRDGKILAMLDERFGYFYLPGGRVQIGETAEQAVIREVQEEIGVTTKVIRPLWLNQAFFTLEEDGRKRHELCIYFLLDVSQTDLSVRGKRFTTNEGDRTHQFEWLEFDRLKDVYFFPLFLKREIFNLPAELKLRTEIESDSQL